MSATTIILRAQTAAAALMVDTVTITRLTGNPTDGNGNTTPTYATIYTGKCKIQQRQAVARPENVGQAEVYISRLEMHLPVSVTGVASDDIATITASRDPDLVSRKFHVRELAHKTFDSARRYQIIEVTS
jgi:hypothetical protein